MPLPFTQNVMIRTSPKPEGPWSGEEVAFVAMNPPSGNVFDAHAHTEYHINDGQTIFVSYSRSTPAPLSSEERLVALTFSIGSQHGPVGGQILLRPSPGWFR